jgi:hypothetical protein
MLDPSCVTCGRRLPDAASILLAVDRTGAGEMARVGPYCEPCAQDTFAKLRHAPEVHFQVEVWAVREIRGLHLRVSPTRCSPGGVRLFPALGKPCIASASAAVPSQTRAS